MLALIALAAIVGAAACTSSSSTTSTTTTSAASSSAADVCGDLTALQTSVNGLLNVNVVQTGTDGVKSALATVQSDLDALAASASAQLGPQVDALKQSLTAVATTLSSGQSVSAIASQLATQLAAVGTAWTNLQSAASSLNCNLGSG